VEVDWDRLAELDDRHWWFAGRRRIVFAELERLPLPDGARLLDAGCGTGRNLVELARFGTAVGTELNAEAAALARGRGAGEVHVAPVEALPLGDAAFDAVLCLDVLEHTTDDVVALRELRRVTAPGGWLIVTVPAYERLWSAHDVLSGHVRRYDRRSLTAVVDEGGWTLRRWTGFNALLLAPAAVARIAQRNRTTGPAGRASELEATPAWLDRVLEQPLRAEAALLRTGRRLPVGLSLLAVLQNTTGDGA
jgi:SAM-dependent methyltransferase